MLITLRMEGQREVAARLGALPEKVRAALRKRIISLTLRLQTKVKRDHLSGPTGTHSLSVGTNTKGHTGGQLRASVFQRLDSDSAAEVVGAVGFSADVPYAAIHEFGGTINVPEMVPVKARALHWIGGGKDVFAMRTKAHTVTMPERAPLRTAFREMRGEIVSGLKEAVAEGLRT